MKLRKTIFPIFVFAASLLLVACGAKKDQTPQVKYETKIVKSDTLTYNVFIPASLHGVQEVDVYPQAQGIIRKVNFTEGVKVSRGQVLFVIDQTEAKLLVQNAQANLAAARAQMETTKLEYESRKKLASKNIVSDYVLSTSRNAYQVAQSVVSQAEAQLSIAKTNLSYCTVTSPITGMIKENGFKIGELADLSQMLCAKLVLRWEELEMADVRCLPEPKKILALADENIGEGRMETSEKERKSVRWSIKNV